MNDQTPLFERKLLKSGPSITFEKTDKLITKFTSCGKFSGSHSLELIDDNVSGLNLHSLWTNLELNQRFTPNFSMIGNKTFNLVDIFCGTGGFTLGVRRGLQALGISSQVSFACDLSDDAEKVYCFNQRPKIFMKQNVANLIEATGTTEFDGVNVPDVRQTKLITQLENLSGNVDIFLAGPPCEGNSNLNNVSRRVDPRNELYVLSVVIGISLSAKIILIENVPTVTSAKQNVVERSKILLSKNGYSIKNCEFVLSADNHLVSQTRKRHFLVAVKTDRLTGDIALEGLSFPPLPLGTVLANNESYDFSHHVLDGEAELSYENKVRVNYLHDNDLYDLPNELRPDCHRLKSHTYPSVYGRMHPDRPAPTLSTGFLSPGRGRYTHPFRRRTITLREGARIQGFPLHYNWLPPMEELGKTKIARLIGDAVPPNLGMTALLIAMAKL